MSTVLTSPRAAATFWVFKNFSQFICRVWGHLLLGVRGCPHSWGVGTCRTLLSETYKQESHCMKCKIWITQYMPVPEELREKNHLGSKETHDMARRGTKAQEESDNSGSTADGTQPIDAVLTAIKRRLSRQHTKRRSAVRARFAATSKAMQKKVQDVLDRHSEELQTLLSEHAAQSTRVMKVTAAVDALKERHLAIVAQVRSIVATICDAAREQSALALQGTSVETSV